MALKVLELCLFSLPNYRLSPAFALQLVVSEHTIEDVSVCYIICLCGEKAMKELSWWRFVSWMDEMR